MKSYLDRNLINNNVLILVHRDFMHGISQSYLSCFVESQNMSFFLEKNNKMYKKYKMLGGIFPLS